MDYTFIHFSALSDAQAGTWSPELSQRLGITLDKLPKIVPPWELVGEVTERVAKDFGLSPGTPIAAGAGDTAAGALGAGIIRPGMLLDTAGTASVLAGCTNQFIADEKNRALLVMRSVVPGLWHPLAYIAGGGLALRWFRDQFFADASERLDPNNITIDHLYELMAEAAAKISPGADGLFFSPHLGGRVCPANSSMRGAWLGFSWGHTKAHFFRAILESVAFEYAYYLEILRDLVSNLELIETRVIGGGARSNLWNQIKADVLGIPYQRLQRAEFATWGSALIAGYAVGLFDDLAGAAARAAGAQDEPMRPRFEVTDNYRPLVEQYIRWQQTLSNAFSSSATADAATQSHSI